MPPDDPQSLAEQAAAALLSGDSAARSLDLRLLGVKPGWSKMCMTVRADMLNGHRTCHGGLIFSLADTAFAVACNSHNDNTVAAAASIDFVAPALQDDTLTAEGRELWRSGRSGLYEVRVTNQRNDLIALFRGRSHRIHGHLVSAAGTGATHTD